MYKEQQQENADGGTGGKSELERQKMDVSRQIGPLTFPNPLHSHFSKILTCYESLTTSEPKRRWKK